jgi:hypothetical protein
MNHPFNTSILCKIKTFYSSSKYFMKKSFEKHNPITILLQKITGGLAYVSGTFIHTAEEEKSKPLLQQENSREIQYKKAFQEGYERAVKENTQNIRLIEENNFQKGYKSGHEIGLQKGREKGFEEGLKEGFKQGSAQILAEYKDFIGHSKEQFEKGYKEGFNEAQKNYINPQDAFYKEKTGLSKQDYFLFVIQHYHALTLNARFRDNPKEYLQYYLTFLHSTKQRLIEMQFMEDRKKEQIRITTIEEIDDLVVKVNFHLSQEKIVLFSEEDMHKMLNLANDYGKIEGFIKAYDLFGREYRRKLLPHLMHLDTELAKMENKRDTWGIDIFEKRQAEMQHTISTRLRKENNFLRGEFWSKYLPFKTLTESLANTTRNLLTNTDSSISENSYPALPAIEPPISDSETAPENTPSTKNSANTRRDSVNSENYIHPLLRQQPCTDLTPTTKAADTLFNVTGNVPAPTNENFPTEFL